MYETAIHVLKCEIERINANIKNHEIRNTRLETAINAMNNIEDTEQHIYDSIEMYKSDIDERNVEIEGWKQWKKAVINEIEVLKTFTMA